MHMKPPQIFKKLDFIDFSVDIINLVKFLKLNHETIIAIQIGRSGTSIGANIHEAQYAQAEKILYPSWR